MISIDPYHYPEPAAEKAHYETHENDREDPRYRAFLGRLATPLVERLPPGARGLDYGSGPGPALSVMLEEQGFPMSLYDPFYAPDAACLERAYDFITCTETAEHFHAPQMEFDRLNTLLKPGGWLGIMTEVFEEEGSFPDWWYRKDPTHVCFYRGETFRWLAGRFGWEWERPGRTVVLFRKRV